MKNLLSLYLLLFLLVWGVSCQAGDCSVDNWCKISLVPPIQLSGIWGSSANDIFAVGTDGEVGKILHYDGVSWSEMYSGYSGKYCSKGGFRDVWGNNGSDVYVLGCHGFILHYNGNQWSPMLDSSVYLNRIWGSSEDDIFAVGQDGGPNALILHYDGVSWSEMKSATFYNHNLGYVYVWGSSGSNVFAIVDTGRIKHYDGTTWSAMTIGRAHVCRGIWGSSDNDIYAVCRGCSDWDDWGNCLEGFTIVSHYDGEKWSEIQDEGMEMEPLVDVWGSGANNVYVVGYDGVIWHYDGVSWLKMESGTSRKLKRIWGSSPNNVFVIDEDGTILRRSLPGPFKLSIKLSGDGAVTSVPEGIHCPSDCTELYPKNKSVTLRTVPAKGAVFGSWSGSGCRGNGTCTVIMDRDRRVSASFGKKGGVSWLLPLMKEKK